MVVLVGFYEQRKIIADTYLRFRSDIEAIDELTFSVYQSSTWKFIAAIVDDLIPEKSAPTKEEAKIPLSWCYEYPVIDSRLYRKNVVRYVLVTFILGNGGQYAYLEIAVPVRMKIESAHDAITIFDIPTAQTDR
jgi:hypothetical protein